MTKIEPNKIYLVVAGCYREFRHWCIEHRFHMISGECKRWPNGPDVSKAIHIRLRESLLGRDCGNVELVFVGSYYMNPLYGSRELNEFEQHIACIRAMEHLREEEQEELPKIRLIRV